jgi:uncharacterized protein YjbJ (UPF0337 family)
LSRQRKALLPAAVERGHSGKKPGHAAGVTTGADSQSNLTETKMNWDRIEGNWKQFKGNAKEQWGKLTDDQPEVTAGKRDNLAGKIQAAYGISKDETEKQLADWQQRMKELRSKAQSAGT